MYVCMYVCLGTRVTPRIHAGQVRIFDIEWIHLRRMMNCLPRSEGGVNSQGWFLVLLNIYFPKNKAFAFFQKLGGAVSRRVTACQWKHRMQDSVSRRVTVWFPDLRTLFMKLKPFWLLWLAFSGADSASTATSVCNNQSVVRS